MENNDNTKGTTAVENRDLRSKSDLSDWLDFISSSVAGMDPFWTVMAVFSFVLSLFGPWWFTLVMLFCAWQYAQMAKEI